MALAFEVEDVVKHFGSVKAVNGISLKSEEGKILGLLGPNGAGKTTVVRMLSTLIVPDKGSARVLGNDVVKNSATVRRSIGLAGQFAAVDELLTGYENLYMVARLYHLPADVAKKRTLQTLEELGLSEAMKRTVKTYSGGMRRRLDLGASLVGRPKILFLDEPTTGLDPRTRLDLWAIIRRLVDEGTSILLTTQYLEEADELADKIAVIDHGKVIAEGTADSLKNQMGGDVLEFVLKPAQQAKGMEIIAKFGTRKPFVDEAGKISLPVDQASQKLVDVIKALDKAGIRPLDLALHRPSLDDVFLTLTGKKADNQELQTKKRREHQNA